MRWRPTDLLRRLPLRTQLTAWNAAVVILLSVLMLIAVEYGGRSMLYSQADAELRGAAKEAALAIHEFGGEEASIVAAIRRKEETNTERGWFVHLLTEGHGAEADGGNAQIAATELDGVHGFREGKCWRQELARDVSVIAKT